MREENVTHPNQNFARFFYSIKVTFTLFLLFTLLFGFYVYTEKQIDRAHELRLQSFRLADELRQSSDDLTRMVREYVVTGNPLYKQHYLEILDIRDGRKARPLNYHNVYWDLVLSDNVRPRPNGKEAPLIELMRQADFTKEEFFKLAQAKINSDQLTKTEFRAMALIESTHPTSDKNYRKALELVFGASYSRAKADIMVPIGEFYELMDTRTLEKVVTAENTATLMRIIVIVFGLLLIFILLYASRALDNILGCSVDRLYGYIARFGKGDFSEVIKVHHEGKNSILDWLSQMQTNLAKIDTQRNQAEEELKQYQNQLEQLVEERTLASLVAKNAFIASMNHELRTPLNAIIGFSGVLKKEMAGTLNEKQKEYLSRIHKAGKRLLSMISDVIDISELESGNIPVIAEQFSLRTLLEEVLEEEAVRMVKRGLQSRLEMEEEYPIYTDRRRLKQSIENYLSNAIKFSEKGIITIRARQLNDWLEVEISDEGIGIDNQYFDKLFQPFERLESRLKVPAGGAGLGLYLTKKIVTDLMKGEVYFRSEVEKGSTFGLRIPRRKKITIDGGAVK